MLALVCVVLWGANSTAVKISATAVPPLTMACLRFVLACTATAVWSFVLRRTIRLSRQQIPMVLCNGFLLYLQIGTFNLGTIWSTSVHSVILVNVFPFFTAVICHFFLPGFSVTKGQVAGLIVAFAGVLAMFGDQLVLPDAQQLRGDLLLIASAAVLGVKFAYVKTLLGRIDALQVVFWEALVSVPLFALSAALFEPVLTMSWTVPAILGVLYQGWAVSGVAFLLWTILLSRHSPNELSAFSFLTPLIGALVGWSILDEPITLFLALGGLLIIVGVYLVNRR